jgi:antitoxin component YwqK of YwqJK toxin-antitoxin module
MKHSITLLLALAILSCSSPETDKEKLNSSSVAIAGIPEGARLEKYDDNPEMEKITVRDEAARVVAQGTLLKGLREGTWTEFTVNGLIKKVVPFVHGKKEGLYIEFNDNGQLLKRISYHNDLRNGEYREYTYSNLKESRFYRNDKLEDTVKIYYDNAVAIMEKGVYKNGIRNGISRWYDQNGKVTIEYEYKNGELVKK